MVDFLDPDLAFDSASSGGVFDPVTNVVRWLPGDLATAGNLGFLLNGTTPPAIEPFYCGGQITNVAVASSGTPDADLTNNLSVAITGFGIPLAQLPTQEICGNGIDDDCDGLFECADADCAAFCRPTLPLDRDGDGDPACFGGLLEGASGQSFLVPGLCAPTNNSAENHTCRASGICGDAPLPAFCCDLTSSLFISETCQRTGCAPVDPNFKESDPPVNIAGYGYTQAGRTMTYDIHYENIGNADAINVSIIDVLDENLDETTLLIFDGGTYDPTNRTIVWTDPLLPPTTPRMVSFQVDVRSDAPPGTRVRNFATIIFPNAVPPSPVDTNFVEHVVPDPNFPITPDLSVIRCTETAPGSGDWQLGLVNEGLGFAYNVTATMLNPPASVHVTNGMAMFAHPDDPDPSVLASVIPNATTTSTDTVRFSTDTPQDPCPTLTWQIQWKNLQDEMFTQDVQAEPDGDQDAVADQADNCPNTFNPDQADSNDDGIGDACSTLTVAIDIKPGSFPNSLNPRNRGVIPVAILTTHTAKGERLDFDATTVDPVSVRFGPDGATEKHARGHIEDVDGDGDPDLVLHFCTRQTGIRCGETSAALTGKTFAGRTITGSDSVRTVGCWDDDDDDDHDDD